MYVLVDMEWISNQHGNHWPTQLAAARVDAQWNTVDTFSVLFRPRDFSLQQWGHMAFSGWSREQFLDGESLYAGLAATGGYDMLVASGSKRSVQYVLQGIRCS